MVFLTSAMEEDMSVFTFSLWLLVTTYTSIFLLSLFFSAFTRWWVYLPTPPFIGGYSPETTRIFNLILSDRYADRYYIYAAINWILCAFFMYCCTFFLNSDDENCLAISYTIVLFSSLYSSIFLEMHLAASSIVLY